MHAVICICTPVISLTPFQVARWRSLFDASEHLLIGSIWYVDICLFVTVVADTILFTISSQIPLKPVLDERMSSTYKEAAGRTINACMQPSLVRTLYMHLLASPKLIIALARDRDGVDESEHEQAGNSKSYVTSLCRRVVMFADVRRRLRESV